MKQAVSVSIGSSQRDKKTVVNLLGETVEISRVGTDGDMKKATQMYRDLDGKVDAFGVGGTDLGLLVGKKWYPLYSVSGLVKDVKHTPVVDGTGLKITLEIKAAATLEKEIGDYIRSKGRSVLIMAGTDRYSLAHSFVEAGYDCIFGDMLYSLGLPIAIRKESQLKFMAATLLPIVGHVPFHWVYPVGESQNLRTPKYEKYFAESTVIAGDCHYITRYMPYDLKDKVVFTNTTTEHDVALFREAGVKYLMTATPLLEGRTFGTNMMEAALLAAVGSKAPVDYRHPEAHFALMTELVETVGFRPQLRELN